MIGAGGTGGHVYPALSASESLLKSAETAPELVYVGTVGGFERPLVEHSGIPFQETVEVQAGPLNGVGLLKALVSAARLALGTLQSLGWLLRWRPAAILLTGGWANVPLALAAWLLRRPVLVYLPDIEPGLTVRVVARFAAQVAITVPDAAQYFRSGQTVVTGYPLRQQMRETTRTQGQQHFGLDPARRTLLIMGGSRGARSINIAIGEILSQLLQDGWQVVHITGELDWERSQEQVGALRDHPDYHAQAYLHEMGLALAAADLVVCRSGASTLGELPYFGIPAILVPYPYAWRYQKTNADYLADQGAALRLDDERMREELYPTIRGLAEDPSRLEVMRSQAQALGAAQGDGAARLASVLWALAKGEKRND